MLPCGHHANPLRRKDCTDADIPDEVVGGDPEEEAELFEGEDVDLG